MVNTKQKKLFYIIISLFIIFIDQLSKYLVNFHFDLIQNKNFILFTLDNVRNFGAAFSLFYGNRIFLSLVSFVFSLILIFLIFREKTIKRIDLYSYALILGGSLGNGIDRFFKGYVIDFINLNFINFPIFNIADVSINIGFILILYSLIKIKN